jgi:hypothetical protein
MTGNDQTTNGCINSFEEKTIGDLEPQAFRCDLFVTHSLTGVTSISSTISNTSQQ